MRFASSINRAPQQSTPGGPSVEFKLRLELKLIADVGFAGFPNAGKSSLLRRISAARPKVADYPFTTLVPNLGVVDFRSEGDLSGKSFVACDIPGLIEGASEGRGLGLAFLKHLERTKVVAYVLDISAEEPTASQAFKALRKEIKNYSQELFEKPGFVVLNKIDMIENPAVIKKLQSTLKRQGFASCAISALTGEGIRELKWKLLEIINQAKVDTTVAMSSLESVIGANDAQQLQ